MASVASLEIHRRLRLGENILPTIGTDLSTALFFARYLNHAPPYLRSVTGFLGSALRERVIRKTRKNDESGEDRRVASSDKASSTAATFEKLSTRWQRAAAAGEGKKVPDRIDIIEILLQAFTSKWQRDFYACHKAAVNGCVCHTRVSRLGIREMKKQSTRLRRPS